MSHDMNLSDICTLILIWQVFSPAKVVFAGVGVPLSVYILFNKILCNCNVCISQAAKNARASQDILVDVFERIEMFFRRLEVYTEVPPTPEMMNIIVRIMAEVLSIFGIAMKVIKQGRMSMYLLHKYVVLTERWSQKFAKKLVRRTEVEDALKRLDKLTQDEVRMATAQNLKITHTVDKDVREVVDTVVAMDDRVASVDNKVAEAIAGALNILRSIPEMILTP